MNFFIFFLLFCIHKLLSKEIFKNDKVKNLGYTSIWYIENDGIMAINVCDELLYKMLV